MKAKTLSELKLFPSSLAVRPHLCTNASALEGGSNCTTHEMSAMSMPRAITSVQIKSPEVNDRTVSILSNLGQNID